MLYRQSRKPDTVDPVLTLIQQQMNALRDQLTNSLSQNTGAINQRLDNAAKLYGDLPQSAGRLRRPMPRSKAWSKTSRSCRTSCARPSLRGGMGRGAPRNLLREILPTEHFEMQYHFKRAPSWMP